MVTTVCPETPININFSGTSGATFEWFNNDALVGIAATGTGNIVAISADNDENIFVPLQ